MASDAQIRTSERKSRGFTVYSGLAQQAGWWEWDGYPGWRFCAWVTSNGDHRGGLALSMLLIWQRQLLTKGSQRKYSRLRKEDGAKGEGEDRILL